MLSTLFAALAALFDRLARFFHRLSGAAPLPLPVDPGESLPPDGPLAEPVYLDLNDPGESPPPDIPLGEPVYIDLNDPGGAWDPDFFSLDEPEEDPLIVLPSRRPESLEEVLRNWASLSRRERMAAWLISVRIGGRKANVSTVARVMNLSRSMIGVHLRMACLKMGVDDKFELIGLVNDYHLSVTDNLKGLDSDD